MDLLAQLDLRDQKVFKANKAHKENEAQMVNKEIVVFQDQQVQTDPQGHLGKLDSVELWVLLEILVPLGPKAIED